MTRHHSKYNNNYGNARSSTQGGYNKNRVRCFECNSFDHFRYYCPNKRSMNNVASQRNKNNNNKSNKTNYFKGPVQDKAQKKSALLTGMGTIFVDKSKWIVDSRSSLHWSGNRKWITDFTPHKNQEITLADGRKIKTEGFGNLPINSEKVEQHIMDNAITVSKKGSVTSILILIGQRAILNNTTDIYGYCYMLFWTS